MTVDNSNRETVSAIAGDRRDVFADLPRGYYGAILADPPWGFKTWSGPEKKVASRGTVAPYQTMEMSDIAALPVSDLAAEDCTLFMWVVWPTINEAFGIADDQ